MLLETIQKVKEFYPEFDIVVVDSDSTDKSCFYHLPPDVKIDFIRNKNWEGHMHSASTITHTRRICLSRTVSPQTVGRLLIAVDFNPTFYIPFITEGGYFTEIQNIFRDSSLDFVSRMLPDRRILGTAHTSWQCTNHFTDWGCLWGKEIIQNKDRLLRKTFG